MCHRSSFLTVPFTSSFAPPSSTPPQWPSPPSLFWPALFPVGNPTKHPLSLSPYIPIHSQVLQLISLPPSLPNLHFPFHPQTKKKVLSTLFALSLLHPSPKPNTVLPIVAIVILLLITGISKFTRFLPPIFHGLQLTDCATSQIDCRLVPVLPVID